MSLVLPLMQRFPGLTDSVLKMIRRSTWLRAALAKREGSRKLLNLYLIERYAGFGNPRPWPLSLKIPYTSWSALRDRTYTGRQLPEDVDRKYPDAAEVVKLFEREGEGEKAEDTSLLFANFAQWFTDSFIRTLPEDGAENWRRNASNHEIDLCQIYGLNDEATRALRQGTKGRLKFEIHANGEVYPPRLLAAGSTHAKWHYADQEFEKVIDSERLDRLLEKVPEDRLTKLFATGLEQGNATPGNILLNTIFLRAHNHIAGEISREHGDWDDDRVFETARNVMIVLLMKIVLHDYIGHVAPFDSPPELDPDVGETKSWKRSNWISIEFGLLYRWHALMPDALDLGGTSIALHKTLWHPDLVTSAGIGPLLTAASKQPARKICLGNTPTFFTTKQKMKLGGTSRQMSIQEKTIRMARRARMRPYNAYRELFQLPPVRTFEELTRDRVLADRLSALYGNVDDLEWYVGIFAEAHGERQMLGELLLRMVAFDAFTHIFGNPLVSKGVFRTETFSKVGWELIEGTTSFRQIVDWVVTDPASVHVSFDYTR